MVQPSTSKASTSEDGAAVESDTLLEGIGKTNKPSLSSEEDKNEDDDLLSKFTFSMQELSKEFFFFFQCCVHLTEFSASLEFHC